MQKLGSKLNTCNTIWMWIWSELCATVSTDELRWPFNALMKMFDVLDHRHQIMWEFHEQRILTFVSESDDKYIFALSNRCKFLCVFLASGNTHCYGDLDVFVSKWEWFANIIMYLKMGILGIAFRSLSIPFK